MACSETDEGAQGGYATAAAAAISLALAVVASAVMAAATTDLRAARQAAGRTRIEYALAGHQLDAAISLMKSEQPGRLRWNLPGAADAPSVEVLAEPESTKLSLAGGAALSDADLGRLGVADLGRLRTRLATAPSVAVGDLDPAPLWRACAPSLFSPVGRGKDLGLVASEVLRSGRFNWRAGETWRIRVASSDGWVDDRVVRFTGAADHPAAIITRRFGRNWERGDLCERTFAAAGRG